MMYLKIDKKKKGVTMNTYRSLLKFYRNTSPNTVNIVYTDFRDINLLKNYNLLNECYVVKLYDNRIKHLRGLRIFRDDLIYIDLSDNYITKIKDIERFRHLIHLDLSDNKIRNIKDLSQLSKLRILKLYGNKIMDISPISNLTHLEVLDIRRNKIKDLSPLYKLVNLQYLYVDVHKFNIMDIAPLQEALPNCHISTQDY